MQGDRRLHTLHDEELQRAAAAATTLILIGSPAGWFVLAVLPVLAWSRMALERHSGAEVAVGLLVGIAAGWAITS